MGSQNLPGPRPLGERSTGGAVLRGLQSAAMLLVLGAVAIALTLFFHEVEVDALRAQQQLTVVLEHLNAQDALEWKAISGNIPPQPAREELEDLSATIEDALTQSAEYGLAQSRADTLRRLAKEYSTAVDRELSLIQAGDLAEAREFDEEVVLSLIHI